MLKKKKTTVARIFVFCFLCLWVVSFALCFSWLALSSLKTNVQYVTDKVGLPKPWMFSNYVDAFVKLEAGDKGAGTMIFNSLWIVFGTIIIQQLSSNTLAYCLAKYKFPGRDLLYWCSILIMMLPSYGTMASSLKLLDALKMYDTPFYLLQYIGLAGFLMPYSCYKSLDWAYAEAAFLDGAGHIEIYFKIMLPQMMPVIVAFSVSAFMTGWNDYMTSLVYLPSFPTLSTGLYLFQQENARRMDYPILFAGLILSTLPVIMVFVLTQNTFLEINLDGGLKG